MNYTTVWGAICSLNRRTLSQRFPPLFLLGMWLILWLNGLTWLCGSGTDLQRTGDWGLTGLNWSLRDSKSRHREASGLFTAITHTNTQRGRGISSFIWEKNVEGENLAFLLQFSSYNNLKQRLNSMQNSKTHILTCPNRIGEGLSIRSLLIIWWIMLSNEKGKAIIFAYWSAWETVCTSSSLNVEKMTRIFTFILKTCPLLSVKRLKKTLTKKINTQWL